MTDRELLQQALKAIYASHEYTVFDKDFPQKFKPIVEAIEAALAQPEQEPVAWWDGKTTNNELSFIYDGQRPAFPKESYFIPLYTAPPRKEWVGLTDDEIEDTWGNTPMMLNARDGGARRVFACAIEAKLKEKNGAT